MATTPTQLPVPSEKPQDLKFNTGKIDEFVTSMGWTYTDRFGSKHYTIEGINHLAQEVMSAFGYVTLTGLTFTTGATVNQNEVLFNTADNSYYKWSGSFASGPKVVPENSTPETTGGIGPGEWLNVGDTALRTDLTTNVWSSKLLVTPAYTGQSKKSIQDKFNEQPTTLDFGALGDGSGRTPADDGVDILSEPWNTWDGTPFKDNLAYSPYEQAGVFAPPRSKPFANTDTWDFIGLSRALWSSATDKQWVTRMPSGKYVVNLDNNRHPLYKGLLIMKGMEQSIIGDGKYETTIVPKEDEAFFAAAGPGENKFQLLVLYRVGGPPTTIERLALLGPDNYPQPMGNLSLIWGQNINGVTFNELWGSSCARGISLDTSSGDSHLKGSTFEFCFNETVYTDASSELSIDFCNLWASAQYNTQHGVYAAGRASITNSRFINYHGYSIYLGKGIASNNTIQLEGTAGNAVKIISDGIFNNNQLTGNASDAMIVLGNNTCAVGNQAIQGAAHPIIQLGLNDGSNATNITVTSSTFIKTDTTESNENIAIIAPKSGSYNDAATRSCLISLNTFQGRASDMVGDAVMNGNMVNGVASQERILGDVIGDVIMNGTGTGASYSVTVSGFYGQGDGSLARGRKRLYLMTAASDGASHSVTAFCYFRIDHNNNVIIVQTIGSSGQGGDITFSASGQNPSFTVQNTGGGGTANYSVTVQVVG
ncbi:hypothetical protein [Buttiauxella noackiae]|uniref:tail fiber/spike domain-containing protein n=1 Tax=Buttiauxella noackiae TaxID=82992 RepID=UPI0028D69E22|nr:hypothetical protein [Buttiauxella noackiae]